MNHEQEVSLTGLAGTSDGAIQASQSRKNWQRPNITIIDIRRTMITLGSGSDGVIGST